MSHHQILKFGQLQTPPIEPRTTGVLCMVQNNKAYWAHIGDSRLYFIHDDIITARTEDHSYVEQLRQQGIISTAQVPTHKYRNYVTRCLGGQKNHPVADLSGPHPLQEGDVILLCTDGFWGALPERPLVNALYKMHQSLSTIVNGFAGHAERVSHPESDNVTVVALRWQRGTINLEPTDFSMSLTDNAATHAKPKQNTHDIDQAIDTLRHIVDLNEFEE